jgi:hypothetical protein
MATPPDFTAGQILTAAQMNQLGSFKIAETTFTTTANPFINGCFTSDYQNYLVQVVVVGSAAGDLFFRMRLGASTPESNLVYDRFGFSWGTSATNLVSANLSAGLISDVGDTANSRAVGSLSIYSPNETTHTTVNSQSWGNSTGTVFFPTHRIETTTAYTGIELTTLSATTLTGSMRVYGFRK